MRISCRIWTLSFLTLLDISQILSSQKLLHLLANQKVTVYENDFVVKCRCLSHTAIKYIASLSWVYCGITHREGGENSIKLNVPLKNPLAKARDSMFPGVKGSYTKSKGSEKAGPLLRFCCWLSAD